MNVVDDLIIDHLTNQLNRRTGEEEEETEDDDRRGRQRRGIVPSW